MTFAIAGVLEGFYGPPWSWNDRAAIMARCVPTGLPWYVWAPKSDPLHRRRWRQPFTDEHLRGFGQLVAVEGLHLGVAISPGLDLGTTDEEMETDAEALAAKLRPVIALGAQLIMIAFDDLKAEQTNGARHAQLICALMSCIDMSTLHVVVIPTHYATTVSTTYLSDLSGGLPPDVLIGWTGAAVINETISAHEAEAFAETVDGRPLALWDNYPVNDAVLSDRLFLLPLSGREPQLSEFCGAYFANAGVQPWASLPALLSVGAWVTTGEATVPWEELDDPVNLAVLAQACDGRELYRLARLAIDEDDTDDLWWWLERIENVTVHGPIGEETAPWIAQAQAEAALSLTALDLLEREPGDPEAMELLFDLFRSWPVVRRGTKTVLGPRFAFELRVHTNAEGNWQLRPGVVVEDRNVTDALCRAAFNRHSSMQSAPRSLGT